jgi:hypothetical protein
MPRAGSVQTVTGPEVAHGRPEQSLAFYTALNYAELGRVPETEFGSLTMI